jgi:gamma-glutamyltranspeptidase/glutathione hydrolase
LSVDVRTVEATATGTLRLETAGALVTANHHLAARAGASMFGLGGNAMDAAAATAFAAGVVEPAMSGIGGRGYIVVLPARSREPTVIDGHERAPLGSSADMFELRAADERRTSGWGPQVDVVARANAEGHLAVAVPGVLRALAVAQGRFGRLPWATVLEPAIALAADGFEVDGSLAFLLATHRERLARHPATAAVFLDPGGEPWPTGHPLVQADLAESLRLIARDGADEFYTGSIARAIAAEMESGGGIVSLADLERIDARVWPAPLSATYREHRLCGVPDAAGTVTLLEIMNLLEGFELAELEPTEPLYLHLLLEVFRAAFEDRFRFVADSAFARGPLEALAAKSFADARRSGIDPAHRSRLEPIDPWDEVPQHPPASGRAVGAGGGAHTTHFSAVDGERMVVAMTQSIIDPFGAGVVVAGTGILLNSAMHNFDPRPGFLRSIAPWKRSAHFGTPLVVLDPDGAPRLALGGGGGTKIVTGLAQMLVNVIDRGWALQEAADAPRVHAEDATAEVEARIAAASREELRRRGHTLEVPDPPPAATTFARINGIEIGRDGIASSGVDFEPAGAAAVDHPPSAAAKSD